MLLRMLELKIPIHEIRNFDCGSWDYPQMREHIDKVEKYIRRPITRLKHKWSFDYCFFERLTQKGFKGYGFPMQGRLWCKGFKTRVLNSGINPKDSLICVGFAVDERKRAFKGQGRGLPWRFPLIEWGWSEQDCLQYCYSKGFDWGGLYTIYRRVSCWCCVQMRIPDLRNLRKHFPALWQRLLQMQSASRFPFVRRGTTVFDYEKRFAAEDKLKE